MSRALELLNISKTFAGVVALEDVSLCVEAGSVHGVLGENGAGKSTLMNIAYGMLRADAGSVVRAGGGEAGRGVVDEQEMRGGIGMVHQHFMLAGALSVIDNVLLGDRRAGQWLNRKAAALKLMELGRSLGMEVDPWAQVETLSVGQQQRVEILKALWRDVRVLILDEPTAVLSPVETGPLLAAIRRLRARGCAVVFISHKLREVRQICDRVTVLRRGRVVWEGALDGVSDEELAGWMVGGGKEERGLPVADCGLRIEVGGHGRGVRLSLLNVFAAGVDDVSLDLRAGEIVGIAGVDGNGQQELSEVIAGLREVRAGQVLFEGVEVTDWPLGRRMEMGLAHVPNDRRREALVGEFSIAQNLALKSLNGPPLARWGVIRWGAVRRRARELARQFDVRGGPVDMPAGALSGGNQQKVVLARELAMRAPRVIVAMNPARGLDLGATNFVYKQLLGAREAGCAVLLISSELDELLAVSDRVGVLYKGRLTMTGFPVETKEGIGRLMAGVSEG